MCINPKATHQEKNDHKKYGKGKGTKFAKLPID
jgi:hypothetical protein